mgnify:CR=1 FL=1
MGRFFFNNQRVSAVRIYVTAGQAAQKPGTSGGRSDYRVTAGQAAQKLIDRL